MPWYDLFSLKWIYKLISLIKNQKRQEHAIFSVIGFLAFIVLVILIETLDIKYDSTNIEGIIIPTSLLLLLLVFLILTIVSVYGVIKSNEVKGNEEHQDS